MDNVVLAGMHGWRVSSGWSSSRPFYDGSPICFRLPLMFPSVSSSACDLFQAQQSQCNQPSDVQLPRSNLRRTVDGQARPSRRAGGRREKLQCWCVPTLSFLCCGLLYPFFIIVSYRPPNSFRLLTGLDFDSAYNSRGNTNPDVADALFNQRKLSLVTLKLRQIPQPVISLMKGKAIGSGLAYALAADVRIGDPTLEISIGANRMGAGGSVGTCVGSSCEFSGFDWTTARPTGHWTGILAPQNRWLVCCRRAHVDLPLDQSR